jgi:hypothetical protein
MDRRTAELINGITGSGIEYNKDEEVVDVCLAIELMKQEAAEKAAAEATLKAREETRIESMITSIRNLMDTTKWTADQAMTALKIPEDERENYLRQL